MILKSIFSCVKFVEFEDNARRRAVFEGSVTHYHDNAGLESDMISVLDDGRWLR